MSSHRVRLAAVVATAVLAVCAAGCSDDDDPSGAPSTSTVTTTEDVETTVATTTSTAPRHHDHHHHRRHQRPRCRRRLRRRRHRPTIAPGRLAGDPHRAVPPTRRPLRRARPGSDRRVLHARDRLRRPARGPARRRHREGSAHRGPAALHGHRLSRRCCEGEPSPGWAPSPTSCSSSDRPPRPRRGSSTPTATSSKSSPDQRPTLGACSRSSSGTTRSCRGGVVTVETLGDLA